MIIILSEHDGPISAHSQKNWKAIKELLEELETQSPISSSHQDLLRPMRANVTWQVAVKKPPKQWSRAPFSIAAYFFCPRSLGINAAMQVNECILFPWTYIIISEWSFLDHRLTIKLDNVWTKTGFSQKNPIPYAMQLRGRGSWMAQGWWVNRPSARIDLTWISVDWTNGSKKLFCRTWAKQSLAWIITLFRIAHLNYPGPGSSLFHISALLCISMYLLDVWLFWSSLQPCPWHSFHCTALFMYVTGAEYVAA